MQSSKPIRLKILTPEDIVYEEAVNHIILPAASGEVGIYHHHAPFMSFLKPGHIKIYLQDSRLVQLDVKGGLFEFKEDSLTILTNDKITKDDIIIEEAEN